MMIIKVLFNLKCIFLMLVVLNCRQIKAQEVYKYVSYEKKGTGKGQDPSNAADFLSLSFWNAIQCELQYNPVKVTFLAGDYKRIFSENPLVLSRIGNPVNQLTLEGDIDNTLFNLNKNDYSLNRSVVLDIVNSQNIVIKNFTFTGNGDINYVLRITSNSGRETKNIIIDNCTWKDMNGIIYGATGAHQSGTSYVTYKNCTFKNIGLNSGSHMIYNSYDSHHISIIDSYFENCTGDYVRFRDNCDYGIVKGSTFIKTGQVFNYFFISMPVFNDVNPGDEFFATNYSFINNKFTNAIDAIVFRSAGYDPINFSYLLTPSQGVILTSGTVNQKKSLLLNNFGIDASKIRVYNNTYASVSNIFKIGSFDNYGSVSKGWTGFASIFDCINNSSNPFSWE